jgi:hypothetical protein
MPRKPRIPEVNRVVLSVFLFGTLLAAGIGELLARYA